jgi:hypothetical protein
VNLEFLPLDHKDPLVSLEKKGKRACQDLEERMVSPALKVRLLIYLRYCLILVIILSAMDYNP